MDTVDIVNIANVVDISDIQPEETIHRAGQPNAASFINFCPAVSLILWILIDFCPAVAFPFP